MKTIGRRAVKNWAAAALSVAGLAFGGANAVKAADLAEPVPSLPSVVTFSVTEIQFQLGNLKSPFFPSAGSKAWTPIVTVQHASSWVFGDVFFFVDFLDDDRKDGFNDKDAYGEFYAYFSSAKLLGMQYGSIVKDIGVVAGLNAGADPNFRAYLPGVYADWNVPGFVVFRTQLTAVIDDSDAPSRQSDEFQFDVSFVRPFEIAGQFFSLEGHAEYTGQGRNKTFGTKLHDWILAQPQLRWDAGYAFTGKKDVFFLGTEYQYWHNKLGSTLDESAFQALAVVRF